MRLVNAVSGPRKRVARDAEVGDGKTLFDFGKGDIVVLSGVGDLNGLHGRIDIL